MWIFTIKILNITLVNADSNFEMWKLNFQWRFPEGNWYLKKVGLSNTVNGVFYAMKSMVWWLQNMFINNIFNILLTNFKILKVKSEDGQDIGHQKRNERQT